MEDSNRTGGSATPGMSRRGERAGAASQGGCRWASRRRTGRIKPPVTSFLKQRGVLAAIGIAYWVKTLIHHILQEDVGVGGVVRHAVVPQRRVPLLDQQVPLLDQPLHHHLLVVHLLPCLASLEETGDLKQIVDKPTPHTEPRRE